MTMSRHLYLCLTIVASVHGWFRGGEPFDSTTTTTDTGTAPIRTDGCPWENDPVTCRFPLSTEDQDESESVQYLRPRTYSSMCFASRAGYGIEHCYSRDDASVLACQVVTDVVCQTTTQAQEKFATLCLAQVSGFRRTDCTSASGSDHRRRLQERRNLQNYGFCPQWYRPVYCTLTAVMFSNDCEATVAGYSLHDCTVPDGGPDGECPSAGKGAVGPVTCHATARFETICLASAANYTPSVDCVVSEDNSTVVTTSITRKCATSGKVQCGRRQRVFDNMCLARKAGFTRKKCQSI